MAFYFCHHLSPATTHCSWKQSQEYPKQPHWWLGGFVADVPGPIPTGRWDSLHLHLQCGTLCLGTAALGEKSVLWGVILHSFQAWTFRWDVWLCRRRANFLLSAVPKVIVLWRHCPSTVAHCCKDEWCVPAHSHAVLDAVLGFPIYHTEFSEHWHVFLGF